MVTEWGRTSAMPPEMETAWGRARGVGVLGLGNRMGGDAASGAEREARGAGLTGSVDSGEAGLNIIA
jgi:hypothetical protein